MARRKSLVIFLSILGLFLVGTVVVLSSVTYYLAIDPSVYLSERQVPILEDHERWNASDHGEIQRIPKILHQTWRTETLPQKWKGISQECRDMMPDYEYMLWTDKGSRDFIAQHYPWFLDTFNDYKYPIQRADSIRYFVLHHFGGIYLDLDIGCHRPLDPLLIYPVILPKTIPVGVSNDLMFAEKGHPFLAQTIHNLATFDHSWILNYPTVMFSTGPMFLSAQYAIFTASHAAAPSDPIRILSKALYGKNAKEGEAPHSFFSHFYGSSWHSDDAAFIGFLGTWGKGLMWIGLIILVVGGVRAIWPGKKSRYSLRRIGGYEVLFPRWSHRTGRVSYHLPRSGMSSESSESSTRPPSPDGSLPTSPTDSEIPVLHLPLHDPPSPSTFDASGDQFAGRASSPIVEAFRRVRNRVARINSPIEQPPPTPLRPRRQPYGRNGVLFFLPAIFTTQSTPDVEIGPRDSYSRLPPAIPLISRPPAPRGSRVPEKQSLFTETDGGIDIERPPSSASSSADMHLIDFGEEPNSPQTNSFARSRNGSRSRLT
ncbi:glycosyltransferase family 32 protein [Mycena floridula]|nr:glycosyltransferase family 32 protein [Mycena floridula]